MLESRMRLLSLRLGVNQEIASASGSRLAKTWEPMRSATRARFRASRAVVAGAGSPFQKRVLEQLDLPKSTARASLKALVANATVEQQGEDYVVVDPLFAEWIATLREMSGEEALEQEDDTP